MARKKKLINKTNVPQYAIEHFARCVFDDIRAFYDSEEGQREFAAWKAEQAELKVRNKTARATDAAALAVFIDISFFLVLAVLTQGVLTRRYENTHFRISRNKQIIRTRLPQGRFGSDYIALVRVTGLEPVRRGHTPLKRACLPIPAHSHICPKFIVPKYYIKTIP